MSEVLYAHEVLVMFADYAESVVTGVAPSDPNAGSTGGTSSTTPVPLSDLVSNLMIVGFARDVRIEPQFDEEVLPNSTRVRKRKRVRVSLTKLALPDLQLARERFLSPEGRKTPFVFIYLLDKYPYTYNSETYWPAVVVHGCRLIGWTLSENEMQVVENITLEAEGGGTFEVIEYRDGGYGWKASVDPYSLAQIV